MVSKTEITPKKRERVFKVGDLLINILPTKVKIDGTPMKIEEWIWCLDHFFCPRRCSIHVCLEHRPPDAISIALGKLKEDLKKQLKTRGITAIREEMRPQSVADVEELEKKLRGALDQLDKLRPKLAEKETQKRSA